MALQRANALPAEGMSADAILEHLSDLKVDDLDWRAGRLPSYTFFFRDDVLDLQKRAYTEYIVENALGGPRVFRSLPTMLADLRDWTLDLFHAPADAGFSFSSGGTESVMLAVKTCRDQARAGRGEPLGHFNIVAPASAHPCLSKAGELMDIEVRRIPVDAERRSDVAALAAAIDDRTIMLYGSAPSYPFGLFDRLGGMSELALSRNLWLHVDACWGGFISAFATDLGYAIPDFDLGLPGVSSLSADLHKFGYTAKGASIVIYRDAAVQEHERFSFSDWPRGTYATPTIAGSKPAGSIAAAWAVMRYLGRDGYREATTEAMEATRRLSDGAAAIRGLEPLDPFAESNLLNIVATDPKVDVNAVCDALEARGWFRGRLREPPAIHQGVTPAHLPVIDEYLSELAQVVDLVRGEGRTAADDERTY
jgi:sphinganine-1-phosphate aldolase